MYYREWIKGQYDLWKQWQLYISVYVLFNADKVAKSLVLISNLPANNSGACNWIRIRKWGRQTADEDALQLPSLTQTQWVTVSGTASPSSAQRVEDSQRRVAFLAVIPVGRAAWQRPFILIQANPSVMLQKEKPSQALPDCLSVEVWELYRQNVTDNDFPPHVSFDLLRHTHMCRLSELRSFTEHGTKSVLRYCDYVEVLVPNEP